MLKVRWVLPFTAILFFMCQNTFALSEVELNTKLSEYNEKYIGICRESALAKWAVVTDIGNQTLEKEMVSQIEDKKRSSLNVRSSFE